MDQNSSALARWILAVIGAAFLSAPTWAAGAKVVFDISAGPATTTLRAFYLQSHVRVLYLSDALKGVETQAVKGEFEVSDALARLLEGTGLTFDFDGASAVINPLPAVPRVANAGSSGSVPHVPPEDDLNAEMKLQEVLVTGSLIHGVFDITSPLIAIEGREIKRVGYGTIQDVVRSFPMAATITRGEVIAGTGNYGRGSSINLRGLGDGATLVLVNGRRQPVSGTRGDFVDVSNIPWSMVERIDVLPDGGSALYGSDAIAGVVNVILRHDVDAAETQLRFGTAHDGAKELLASQLLGRRWDRGQWLAGYQYSERTSLAAADRDYTANSDKRPLGGRDFRSLSSNPGNILDPQTLQPLFAIPRGQDGTSLSPGALLPGVVNYRNQVADAQLVPDNDAHNLYFTASQHLSERVELFAEGRYAQRDIRIRPLFSGSDAGGSLLRVPATNPFFVDPFGGAPFVLLAYDFTNELGPIRDRARTQSYLGTLGLNAELGAAWHASLSSSLGAENLRRTSYGSVDPISLAAALADSDPATAFNPFGDGAHTDTATIAAVHLIDIRKAQSEISSIQFAADGPVFDLPSGTAKMAIGAEYRRESLSEDNLSPKRFDQISARVQGDRTIAAAFAEFSVPLIGNPADPYAPPRLELSLAGRYEQYDDFGHTFNPKVGLRWTPLKSVKLRASWSTSFRAPSLIDLDDARNTAILVSIADPRSASGRSDALGLQGGNPDLKEERATTWTAGLDLAPQVFPGLRLSLTTYSIEYEDQVIQPGPLDPSDILFQEDQWAPVITRNPSQSQIDAICESPQFFGAASQCHANQPTVIVDIRKRNLAITKMQGLDLRLNQSFGGPWGYLDVEVDAARVFHFTRAFTKTAPALDVLDTVNNPLALRLRGTVEWHQNGKQESGLGANLTVHYTGGYRNPDSPVRRSVSAWATFDLGLNYRTAKRGAWTDVMELAINVANVLNEDPPFVDREWGYDVNNAQPLGRVLSATISKRW